MSGRLRIEADHYRPGTGDTPTVDLGKIAEIGSQARMVSVIARNPQPDVDVLALVALLGDLVDQLAESFSDQNEAIAQGVLEIRSAPRPDLD
ncbi:MAG: hypothetical protein J0H73_11820 [Salana multivorans]|uniref:hypothetical protein n=1 Tax=Salana multivorans TaxID=120377 RepID=UPI0009671FCE|nr:hypothetical protein [Salana multivorans]MBN8882987.1 hypothetical protein [Salana multivorans]OJX94061.1 MAG: hypothetical protein BGO96_09650 [Micrococcales bacterium 73-15]